VRAGEGGRDDEILVPLAPEFVRAVERRARRVVVWLPYGLESMNRG
jgi:hypothetical protein